MEEARQEQLVVSLSENREVCNLEMCVLRFARKETLFFF